MTETDKDKLLKKLLEDLRIYLGITWDDEDLDKKILGLAERGMTAVDRAGGREYDYLKEASPRQLLFDYVRYGRDDALDQWAVNFGSELRTLAVDNYVDNYVEKPEEPNHPAPSGAPLQEKENDDEEASDI